MLMDLCGFHGSGNKGKHLGHILGGGARAGVVNDRLLSTLSVPDADDQVFFVYG